MKKIVSIIVLIIVGVTFVTCKNDVPTPTPTKVLSISAQNGALPYPEMWMVAWDDDGTLLDYKKFTADQTLTLSTTETITNDKVTLGFFRQGTVGTTVQTFIVILTDLEVGRDIIYAPASSTQGNPQGSFALTVKDQPDNSFINISSKAGGDSNNGIGTGGATVETLSVDIPQNVNKFIVNFWDHPNNYALIDNVKNGDNITIQGSDFKPYENEVSFNLPDDYTHLQAEFYGLEADQSLNEGGYALDLTAFSNTTQPTFTSGYFDGITKFKVNLSLNYNDALVRYYKAGNLPGTITWPDVNKYSVDSADPKAFSVSVGEPVEWITASWSTQVPGIYNNLTITSPKLAPKIGDVPNEMISLHPEFSINKNAFSSWFIEFTMKGSTSYDEYLSMYFSNSIEEYQQTTVGFSGN